MPTALVNGTPIYYDADGQGDPILWIQGLGADHSAWLAQLYHFQRSFHCIAMDNRDVGRSATMTAPYTVADMADDAAALLSTLSLPSAHVVGLSQGGSIAQELTLRHPGRVRTLTLVSSLARPDAKLRHLLSAWPDIYRAAGPLDFYRQGLPWLLSYRFFDRPRSVSALLNYLAGHAQPPEAFTRQVVAGLEHDTLARLSQIAVPTLVVAGEEDILVPLRLSRALVAGIPGATLSVIPGAGHSVNVEQAPAFNSTVEQFLRAH